MQAHPPGGTEVYVIVAVDPGATIRLGFSKDVDAKKLAAQLELTARAGTQGAVVEKPKEPEHEHAVNGHGHSHGPGGHVH